MNAARETLQAMVATVDAPKTVPDPGACAYYFTEDERCAVAAVLELEALNPHYPDDEESERAHRDAIESALAKLQGAPVPDSGRVEDDPPAFAVGDRVRVLLPYLVGPQAIGAISELKPPGVAVVRWPGDGAAFTVSVENLERAVADPAIVAGCKVRAKADMARPSLRGGRIGTVQEINDNGIAAVRWAHVPGLGLEDLATLERVEDSGPA